MSYSLLRSTKPHATSVLALIALLGGMAVQAQVGTGRVGVKPLPGAEMKVKKAPGAVGVKAKPPAGAEMKVKEAPIAVGKVKSAQPAKVEAVRVAALLAITQISAGQLTPQQAWERDLLNANDILQLLSQPRRLT